MGADKWTREQLDAIEERGCDLLVSAAAGSGKTAVLVERIIRRITTDKPPIDVDRLLVVTFTNAAAAEMSQRIGEAIAKKMEEEPDNLHLKNQMTLLNRADIKTIHAFCLQTIKEYYYLLDIDPGVRTADPAEIKLLMSEVTDDYFEELYEREEPGFFRLLETFSEPTGDKRLRQLIIQLYNFIQGYPDPQELIEKMTTQYELKDENTLRECCWLPLIKDGVTANVEYMLYLFEKAMRLASSAAGFDGYLETLEAEAELAESLLEAVRTSDSYERWHMAYVTMDFGKLPSYRGQEKDTAKAVQDIRKEIKATADKLGERFFCYDEKMQAALLRGLYPVAKALGEVTLGFAERFAQAKKEKLIIDFSDYEHFCLKILVEKGSTVENIMPTEAAREIQKKYDEIMIDEYQDSNMVQELILAAVSGEKEGKNNRFMVGDVKQSIYRFRLAMPELFNEKYDRYTLEKKNGCRKIVLSKNFRSRENILYGTNFIFSRLMRRELGDVEYDKEAALYPGAVFPPADEGLSLENEVLLAETQLDEDAPEEIQELDRRRIEALMLARKIKAMINGGMMVSDKATGEYRPLVFRDIAILLRTTKNWGDVLNEVFSREGIPFYAETSEGYFDVAEIDTVIHILRLLDNPRQDISLLAALHSPLYALSADELMQIRLIEREGQFFNCIEGYIEKGEDESVRKKLISFWQDITRWRQKIREMSLHELLYYIYQESGYYDYVGITPGGGLRQANLRLLIEKAEQFEAGGRKGLFYFIRYVEDLKTAEAESSAAKLQGAAENLVQVMTIHKSKGLEFPVVFVADTGKVFNETDTRAPLMLHQKWGMGMDITDTDKRVTYRTLSKTALAEAIRRENLSEELRILYVALTRAKEKLILTGSVKSMESALAKWDMGEDIRDERLPLFPLVRARCYLDWLMPALLKHSDSAGLREKYGLTAGASCEDRSSWIFSVFTREELLTESIREEKALKEKENIFASWDTNKDYSGKRKYIFDLFNWSYPHKAATKLPGKLSISEIKRRFSEARAEADILPEFDFTPYADKNEKRGELSAAEIGTAMHLIMENADLTADYDKASLDSLIEGLKAEGRLTAREAESIHREELLKFFASRLSKRLKKADHIEREKPFAMLLPAREVLPDEEYKNAEDKILINGIIDCYFIEGDNVVLLDYKSDRLFSEEEFIQRYEIQLKLYRRALENSLNKRVGEAYIYSFAMGREILLR